VFRQGFWAEEQWKENYCSSRESARILNLRNNGAMYLRPFCQSARILHRDPERS
jgi:hypothetical protein